MKRRGCAGRDLPLPVGKDKHRRKVWSENMRKGEKSNLGKWLSEKGNQERGTEREKQQGWRVVELDFTS